jgi:GMP synthase-like glutamine amidotransferase
MLDSFMTRPPLLYVTTVTEDVRRSRPAYEEDRKILGELAERPCRLIPYSELAEVLPEIAKGAVVVLSGGPAGPEFPEEPVTRDPGFLELVTLPVPMFAICRSFQLIGHLLGMPVVPMPQRAGLERREAGWYEAGTCQVLVDPTDPMMEGLPSNIEVCQCHRNELRRLPPGFLHTGWNEVCTLQAWRDPLSCRMGTQFHPERGGHAHGHRILRNFFKMADLYLQ